MLALNDWVRVERQTILADVTDSNDLTFARFERIVVKLRKAG